MAKEIKAIKCPHCGSTDKTELKPDHYRCNSCQTEYFLDNDDININHRYTYNYTQPADDHKTIKTLGIWIIGIMVFFVLAGIVISKLKPARSYKSSYNTATTSSVQSDEYTAFYSKTTGFLSGDNEPVVVSLMQRNYYGNEKKSGSYLSFYNPIKKEFIKESKVDFNIESSSDMDFRTFNDGNLYLTVKKSHLFLVDKNSFQLKEVTEQVFNGIPQLTAGVASFEFVYNRYGDGLKVMTNDGKTFNYYPGIKKVYTEDQLYTAQHGMNTLLPNAKEKTYIVFSDKSMHFPEEKLQLLKITYMSNAGGPEDKETSPSWSRDFGGSGIFTDRDPYRKVLIDKSRHRVVRYTDLTPGRLYFEPSVVYYDDKQVLIDYKATPSPGAPTRLQCLDAETGKIKWSTDIKEHMRGKVIPYSGGFVAVNDYSADVTLISAQGKVTEQYSIK
ncbi:hypothetical protein KHS38_21120 [Mucilaginibacter sp. Bleaf8]|uniref:hypothetical protein n=1 Tax=Mucilaginibacter sp. Bleaf8 TaxID=2834430 RepID=UPI001BCE13DC|nr:hypothetical protein [Mucilaginibacter sp. Bleaf8]MBS7566920.1 hypothetical protein [Mucilaginibacter sp. Bleaf8]